MADPISGGCSIVEVTSISIRVAQKITQIIKEIIDAPEELLALSNEVWNFQYVLDAVRAAQDEADAASLGIDHGSTLAPLLFQARVKLDQISNLTKRWGRLSAHGDSWQMGKRARFLWLKDKGKAAESQSNLRELRSQILAVTGTNVLSVSTVEIF